MQILVVEDDCDAREIFRLSLSYFGGAVTRAAPRVDLDTRTWQKAK
jgi:hypothetical protein